MNTNLSNRNIILALIAIALIGAATYFLARERPVSKTEQTLDAELGQFNDRTEEIAPVAPGEAPEEPLVAGCALRFSVMPESKAVPPGGEAVYDVRLSNAGSDPCQNASFSLYYSDQETFAAASPEPSSSTYYWNVGTLASRDSYSVRVRTQVAGEEGSEIANDACATADNGSDACAQNVLFISSAPSTIATAAPTPPPATGLRLSASAGDELGVWIWESPAQQGPGYAETALSKAASYGFSAVYVTVDDYLELESEESKRAYMDEIAAFVSVAGKHGIAVDIEGGGRDWGEPENRWKGYALIDLVAMYNQAHPEARVRGLQYDVESYLMPGYEDNKEAALQNFVAFIDESATRMQRAGGSLSVVIPHFYDSAQAWTPAVPLNGKNAHAFTHVKDSLSRVPNSSIVIMAYRDYFDGDNGTRQISEQELKEAEGSGVRVIVAQEMGNVEPAYVTFYGSSKSEAIGAVRTLISAFSGYGSFGGAAVHYLDPFLALP